MPEIGRQVRELGLRVDARLVPLAHPVTNHRVAHVVDSWPDCAARGVDPRAPQYVRQHKPHPSNGVTPASLRTPEQGSVRIRRGTRTFTQAEIVLEGGHNSGCQRQAAMLEELRFSDV